MSSSPKLIVDYPACTSPTSNDYVLGVGNNGANTFKYKISDLYQGMLKVSDTPVSSPAINAPANSISGGYPNNSFFVDDNYLYRVLANGLIKRVAFSTF